MTTNKQDYKCWKCGCELTYQNQSNIVYTSNPPKYSCKKCEGQSIAINNSVPINGQWNITKLSQEENNIKEEDEYALSEEEIYKITHGIGIIPYINSLLKERSTRFYEKGKEEGMEIITNIVRNSKPIPPEIQKIVNENFIDLI